MALMTRLLCDSDVVKELDATATTPRDREMEWVEMATYESEEIPTNEWEEVMMWRSRSEMLLNEREVTVVRREVMVTRQGFGVVET
jgi:hypothetical protein